MKRLVRRDKTYKLNKLPKLEVKSFNYGSITGYSGSIVRRKIKGPVKVYWHYAFILGFDKKGTLFLIENNEDGVECITWNDFILDFSNWEFFHIELNPNQFESILARAKERAKYSYHSRKNNCEHFVNYCIFEKLESIQVENTKLGINVMFMYLELRLLNTPSPSVPSLLKQLNKMRDLLEVNRGDNELDQIIQSRINNSE